MLAVISLIKLYNDYEFNELNELAGAGKKSLAISIREIRINKQHCAAKIREIRGKKILTKLELLFHIVETNFF